MEHIARVYAEALFGVAKEKGKLDAIRDQLGQFADALAENKELQLFFFSPYFSSTEKEDGLSKAVSGAEPELVNFLDLLLEKHRMPVLFRIRKSTGIRCFSSSRSRKLTSSGSAPDTALLRPSSFSADEK